MNTHFIATTALPLALSFIMFGLGLTLSLLDFRRIILVPYPIIIGLICQMLVLPLVALGLCYLFHLPAPFAIGLMLLAASPGGVTANIFSHLSNGDVALNLTLTAINSALAAVTLPLISGLAVRTFSEQDPSIAFQFSKMIEVFGIVIVPVSIGMWVHAKWPNVSKRMDWLVRIFSLVVLITIVAAAIIKEWALLTDHLAYVGWAVVTFNLLSLGLGYILPMALKIPHQQATAISFEIGIHNGTLAIFVAVSVMGSYSIAVPSAIYSVVMFFTATAFWALLKARSTSRTGAVVGMRKKAS